MGKLRFINTNDLPVVPWKNGGGTTREVAQVAGPKGFAWRLSIADVETDGAFSCFAGMSRILTVIEGDGLELHDPDQVHEVLFCQPFAFSGETQIRSVLRSGKIRDFNVIFDPDVMDAKVTVLSGPLHMDVNSKVGTVYALFGVTGAFSCEATEVRNGIFTVVEDGSVNLEVHEGSQVLLVGLTNHSMDFATSS